MTEQTLNELASRLVAETFRKIKPHTQGKARDFAKALKALHFKAERVCKGGKVLFYSHKALGGRVSVCVSLTASSLFVLCIDKAEGFETVLSSLKYTLPQSMQKPSRKGKAEPKIKQTLQSKAEAEVKKYSERFTACKSEEEFFAIAKASRFGFSHFGSYDLERGEFLLLMQKPSIGLTVSLHYYESEGLVVSAYGLHYFQKERASVTLPLPFEFACIAEAKADYAKRVRELRELCAVSEAC